MQVAPTKLYRPTVRPGNVDRPGLLQRLDAALHYPLTLIAAPAGYGKTTLLATWVTHIERSPQPVARSSADRNASALPLPHPALRCAWLALDAADNDPTRLLAGLVAAFQTVMPALGAAAIPLLSVGPTPDYAAALAIISGDVLAHDQPLVLILDDTHLLTDRRATALLAALVERQPPQLHLILAGRADPPLPLARLRARGQLNELRAAELRFTPVEVAAFLRTTMHVALTDPQVAHLAERTEGWPAGVQLAALAYRQHADPRTSTVNHVGRHRFILDYLADEVLAQQSAEIQQFLLMTSMLDRMCGELCAAVLDDRPLTSADRRALTAEPPSALSPQPSALSLQPSALSPQPSAFSPQPSALSPQPSALSLQPSALLETLEQANLFLIPLDDERRWYRYHHLFADLLRYRLQQRLPERIPALHRRAAHWFAAQGLLDEAVHHALAAGDVGLAAELIATEGRNRLARGELVTLQTWLNALPPEHRHTHPRLLLLEAWTHVWAYQPEAVAAALAQVAHQAEALPPELAAEVLALEVFMARSRDDRPAALRLAQQALAQAGDDPWLHGFIHAGMGDMAWFAEDVAQALECHRCALAYACRGGDLVQLVDATHSLAQFELLQGRLTAAEAAYAYGDQLLAERGAAAQPFRELLALSRAGVLYERYDLAAARAAAELGLVWATRCGLSAYEPFVQIELARITAAQGDTLAARRALLAMQQGMQRLAGTTERELPVWFETLRVRQVEIWITLGDTTALVRWAIAHWTPPDPDAAVGPLIRQFALATALVACLDHAEHLEPLVRQADAPVATLAAGLIASCRQRFTAWGLGAVVIELETLAAVLHWRLAEPDQAFAALERALVLAAPEGFVRPFLNRGAPMHALCAAALTRRTGRRDSVTVLLRHLHDRFPPTAAPAPGPHILAESLTPREIDLLPLLAAGLSHREIAARLTIAPDTARTHIKNIYGKLQVQNRMQAIERARGFGLLEL
jgi:LuxR family transcriptional regulator, maltose regulon positive regulatory protein